MSDDEEFSHLVKLNYKINETAEILGVGRDQVYNLLNNGTLEGVKVGLTQTSTRVTRKSIVQYQKGLPKYERENEKRREYYGKTMRKKKQEGDTEVRRKPAFPAVA